MRSQLQESCVITICLGHQSRRNEWLDPLLHRDRRFGYAAMATAQKRLELIYDVRDVESVPIKQYQTSITDDAKRLLCATADGFDFLLNKIRLPRHSTICKLFFGLFHFFSMQPSISRLEQPLDVYPRY